MSAFGFQWHITERCNLRCAHCYQDSFSPQSECGLVGLKELANRILGGLPERTISVNITGGEPLLAPELFDLVEHLHSFANLEEIHLITNGTVVTEAVLRQIRGFPKIGCLKVSLESGVTQTNDAVRGEGNLATVGAHIPLFREQTGKPIVLMTTLGRYNLGTIPETVEYAEKVGASGIIFERFVPLGRGRDLSAQVLAPGDWQTAVAAIARAAGLDADPFELLSYHAFWVWTEPNRVDKLQGAQCNLGDESMALMPDGTVFPCRRLPLSVGNALDEPFERILGRLEQYRIPAIRKRLRGNLCGQCRIAACAGCRALAHAVTGDAMADDPLCMLLLDRLRSHDLLI